MWYSKLDGSQRLIADEIREKSEANRADMYKIKFKEGHGKSSWANNLRNACRNAEEEIESVASSPGLPLITIKEATVSEESGSEVKNYVLANTVFSKNHTTLLI